MWMGVQRMWNFGVLLALIVPLAGCPLFGDDDGEFGPCIGPGCVCRVTPDCPTGQVCSPEGTCVDGCRADGDCAQGFECGTDNRCVASTTCTDSTNCSSGICDFRGTCVTPPTGGCGNDTDCDGSDVCVEGFCRARSAVCQFNSDCGAGRACVNNRCTEICGSSSDCGPGEACEGGFCRPLTNECASTDDCLPGEFCVDGRCFADCQGSGACSESGALCADDDFCRPDIFPRPFCTENGDCATGAVCRNGVCRTPCPSGMDNECLAADVQLPVCGPELLCLSDNEATPECFAQSDCSSGESCIDGDCR